MTPYCTVEEADEYFLSRLNSEDWDDASDVEKLQSLNMATRAINNLNFRGTKILSTQEHLFPRTFTNLNNITESYGSYNNDLTINYPTWLKEATCEIAINLLDGTDMEQEAENLLAVGQSYATVTTNYNPQLVSEHMRAGVPSIVAWNLLRPYLINPRVIRLTRG